MTELISSIELVLKFCKENQDKKLKCNTMRAKISIQELKYTLKKLQTLLNLDLEKFDISLSYGSGYFPKVPWIGITPKGKKVSNSISVCICFSREGVGIVAGAMFSEIKRSGELLTVNRIMNESPYIALNGSNPRSTYTQKFVNPRDFYSEAISEEELLSHINKSITLMDAYLNKTK